MKRKKIMVLCAAGLALVLILFSLHRHRQAAPESAREQAYEMMNRVDGAVQDVLGDDFKKQSVTEIIPVSAYADKDGNEAIVYYICKTTYYEVDPSEITGFHEEVAAIMIDPDVVTDSHTCKVNDLDAMLYETEGRSYLCWTVTPEYTLILEYDPEALTEEEMIRMAESVDTQPIEK